MSKALDNETFAKLLQADLKAAGLYAGTIDGWAGSATRTAYAQFKAQTTPEIIAPPVGQAFKEITRISPNRRVGGNKKEYLVLHHTNGWSKDADNPNDGDDGWILNPSSGVSYHCIIAWNGDRVILVEDNDVAFHAGKSRWAGKEWCNSFTIGLAVGGDTNTGEMRPGGQKTLTQVELASVVEYVVPRMRKYGWGLDNIITHEMIAPDRKTDTSKAVLEQVKAEVAKYL